MKLRRRVMPLAAATFGLLTLAARCEDDIPPETSQTTPTYNDDVDVTAPYEETAPTSGTAPFTPEVDVLPPDYMGPDEPTLPGTVGPQSLPLPPGGSIETRSIDEDPVID